MATTSLSIPDRVVNALVDGDKFATMLPACYREAAVRWIQRGKLYMLTCKNSEKLLKCTPQSLVRAFLQGAEQGIPIDGKMGYLVPYGTEATFMPSYIGIAAVARRHNLVVDATARILREKDEFDLSMVDGFFKILYRPHIGIDAGETIGAFCSLIMPGKRVVADFMNVEEIESIRKRSKAATNGPWVTDWGEMAKKTVLRRTIKTYVDDPEVLAMLERDDEYHGIVEGSVVEQPRRIGARKAVPLRLSQEPQSEPEQEPEAKEEGVETLSLANEKYANWARLFAAAATKAEADAVFGTTKPHESPDDEDEAVKLHLAALKRIGGK